LTPFAADQKTQASVIQPKIKIVSRGTSFETTSRTILVFRVRAMPTLVTPFTSRTYKKKPLQQPFFD
jgi:hypothetical protein